MHFLKIISKTRFDLLELQKYQLISSHEQIFHRQVQCLFRVLQMYLNFSTMFNLWSHTNIHGLVYDELRNSKADSKAESFAGMINIRKNYYAVNIIKINVTKLELKMHFA